MVENKTVCCNKQSGQQASSLEAAIWRTIAYVDGFDYPLTAVEIHRYLEKQQTTLAKVEASLIHNTSLSFLNGYYTLPDRESIVKTRAERTQIAQQLWPHATYYAQLIAKLPFVRMIAVTGSLAMNNVTADADVDYLIVTEHGRLWLTRALIIVVVKMAMKQEIILCPNYILSQNNLHFNQQNLYTAHELSQMIPLSGLNIYGQMRKQNEWTTHYLPNATMLPTNHITPNKGTSRLQRWLEPPLRSTIGNGLEQWEMKRKIHKLQTAVPTNNDTQFTANLCKGHFDSHQQRAIQAYQLKIKTTLNDYL